MVLRAKGTKDYAFEEAMLRKQVLNTIEQVLQSFGFNALETPILERLSTLTMKYAGGSEILKEVFKLKDQANRDLGLRYDLTVPLARFIALNPQIKLPFKRYQIGKVFRDGPVKLGRYREFVQIDFDVVGAVKPLHDVEVLQVLVKVFEKLELDVELRVNDRALLNEIIKAMRVEDEEQQERVIIALDKLDKLSVDEVKKELMNAGLSMQKAEKLLSIVMVKGSNSEKLEFLKQFVSSEALQDIDQVLKLCQGLGLKNIVFTPSLARGLSYYTGIIFEVFLKDLSIKSSLAAGGRYDNMISFYVSEKGDKQIPAVGASFGLDVIVDALKMRGVSLPKTNVQVLVIGVGVDALQVLKTANALRLQGLNVDIAVKKSLSKNLEYANAYGIPFVVIIGKQELDKSVVKLKNMGSGFEVLVPLQTVKEKIKELTTK
ncbi:histidine--tRNA ligase [Candidatus Woesearchaeota archaeon]|nr:histidine--tRNA ligase [Candidatus Woesearchaeota archaeon]